MYNMVRIIAGTLIKVGAGEFAPQEMQTILDACDRVWQDRRLPAHGLTMIGLGTNKSCADLYKNVEKQISIVDRNGTFYRTCG